VEVSGIDFITIRYEDELAQFPADMELTLSDIKEYFGAKGGSLNQNGEVKIAKSSIIVPPGEYILTNPHSVRQTEVRSDSPIELKNSLERKQNTVSKYKRDVVRPSSFAEGLVQYKYTLKCDGTLWYFDEVTGLRTDTEVVSVSIAGENSREMNMAIPGMKEISPVVFKRRFSPDLSLWEWRAIVVQGQTENARKHCIVTMYDSFYTTETSPEILQQAEFAKWILDNAWPTSVEVRDEYFEPRFIEWEYMMLVHEGISRDA